jgi:tetratricopeptide (TPR) repeat protein
MFPGYPARNPSGELHSTKFAPGEFVPWGEGTLLPNSAALKAKQADTTESIIQLVEAVHCHARTLALLAPSIRTLGVERTHADLVKLMAEMERRYPGNREQSVYASVELSLRRLSPANQDKVKVLGVFQGGVNLAIIQIMMQWEQADVAALAEELIATGLATPNPYNHLSLNPALCPYLLKQLDEAERETLTARWVETMRSYVSFLNQQESQNAELAATLTGLELPNLFALLERVQLTGEPEATIGLTTSLYSLLSTLGKPRLLQQVGQVRDAAAATLGDSWNHARFQAQRTRIEQQLGSGRLREAYAGANALLQRARTAGEQAYPDADYDLAIACFLLARVLQTAGGSEPALPLLDEAQQRFELIEQNRPGRGAAGMASACLTGRGDCLSNLGRLDDAAAAYEERIRRGEKLGDERGVAVGKIQLGTVRYYQQRYKDALTAYREAREQFMRLDEPGSVATGWHQTGMVYQAMGQPEAAEDAYRQSLAINVRLGDDARQAHTLNQLGILYDDELGRTEEAIGFLRLAADKYVEIGDKAKEGVVRSNLAILLRKLHRFTEARQEIHRAIECNAPFGHASTPWKTWANLADIETDDGNPAAAAEGRAKALDCYLAYRRDGGENHNTDGRIALAVTQALQAGDNTAAAGLLQQQASRFQAAGYPSFIPALQAILAGSRDQQLAQDPDLHYSMATEILLLLENL